MVEIIKLCKFETYNINLSFFFSSSFTHSSFSFLLHSAYEISAAAAEVFRISGGWQSSRSSAGAPRRADTAQVQHRPHPRS